MKRALVLVALLAVVAMAGMGQEVAVAAPDVGFQVDGVVLSADSLGSISGGIVTPPKIIGEAVTADEKWDFFVENLTLDESKKIYAEQEKRIKKEIETYVFIVDCASLAVPGPGIFVKALELPRAVNILLLSYGATRLFQSCPTPNR